MQILTAKEFDEIKSKEVAPAILAEQPLALQEQKSEIIWRLFYSDNSENQYHSGNYFVEINGKREELKIENGIIETDNKIIKNLLIEQGFILMYEVRK